MSSKPEEQRPSGQSVSQTLVGSRRRLWLMRATVLLLPFIVVGLLESVFRIVDLYGSANDEASKRHVEFEAGVQYFPEWQQQIPMPKPADSFRVFTLGGSCTMGFGVDQPFATALPHSPVWQQQSKYLQQRRWEIINGGRSAYGSHRVLEILKWASEFDPDLIVVYLGHNEFLEEIFFDPEGWAARVEQAERFARKIRVANWLRQMIALEKPRVKPKLQRHFLGNDKFPLIRSDEQYALRLKFFGANLEQMIEHCERRSIRVVFLPAARNLLWPPGDSVHGAGHASRADEWNGLYANVSEQVESAAWKQAIDSLTALHAIDDQYAQTHYWLGLALLAIDETDKARQELVAANQLDKRGDRANADIVRVVKEVCQRRNVPWIEVEPLFNRELPNEFRRLAAKQGLQLFLDHCHPTEQGHAIIADAIAEFLISNEF